MRFVAVKTPEQQSVMMLHRVRLMLNRQRTQLSNEMRAHMSEFGIVAPVGRLGLVRLLAVIGDRDDERTEERRVGKECGSPCRGRRRAYADKKKKTYKTRKK